jgi:hypothetical protein
MFRSVVDISFSSPSQFPFSHSLPSLLLLLLLLLLIIHLFIHSFLSIRFVLESGDFVVGVGPTVDCRTAYVAWETAQEIQQKEKEQQEKEQEAEQAQMEKEKEKEKEKPTAETSHHISGSNSDSDSDSQSQGQDQVSGQVQPKHVPLATKSPTASPTHFTPDEKKPLNNGMCASFTLQLSQGYHPVCSRACGLWVQLMKEDGVDKQEGRYYFSDDEDEDDSEGNSVDAGSEVGGQVNQEKSNSNDNDNGVGSRYHTQNRDGEIIRGDRKTRSMDFRYHSTATATGFTYADIYTADTNAYSNTTSSSISYAHWLEATPDMTTPFIPATRRNHCGQGQSFSRSIHPPLIDKGDEDDESDYYEDGSEEDANADADKVGCDSDNVRGVGNASRINGNGDIDADCRHRGSSSKGSSPKSNNKDKNKDKGNDKGNKEKEKKSKSKSKSKGKEGKDKGKGKEKRVTVAAARRECAAVCVRQQWTWNYVRCLEDAVMGK